MTLGATGPGPTGPPAPRNFAPPVRVRARDNTATWLATVVALTFLICAAIVLGALVRNVHDEHVEANRLAWCSRAVGTDELGACLNSFEEQP